MQAFQLWWQFVMHILQEPVFFCLSTSRLWEEGVGWGGACCHRGRVHSGQVASVSQRLTTITLTSTASFMSLECGRSHADSEPRQTRSPGTLRALADSEQKKTTETKHQEEQFAAELGFVLVTWLGIKKTVYMSQLFSKVKIGRGLSNLFVNCKNFEYFIIYNMHESGLHYDHLPDIVLSPLFQSKQHWPIGDWTPLDVSSSAVVSCKMLAIIPVSCEMGPPWIKIVSPAYPTDRWGDWDLGNLKAKSTPKPYCTLQTDPETVLRYGKMKCPDESHKR